MDWTNLLQVAASLATETSRTYGPVVWDTALWLVRIDCLTLLVPGFVALLVPIIYLYFFSGRVNAWVRKADCYDDGPGIARGFLLVGFVAAPVIPASVLLLNIWNWVGLFWPELLLAKQVLDKVT